MQKPVIALVSVLLAVPVVAQDKRPVDELAPGSLLICGGGNLPDSIKSRFVRLAGGKKARLVIIPTASARADAPDASDRFLRSFRGYEVAELQTLHTRDRSVADTAGFLAPLTKATGVWLSGGQQSRLSAAYHGTKVVTALRGVLKRGGVVAGTSAGAAIQSGVMIAGGKAAPEIMQGFDLLPGCIIDQHFRERKRLPRLVRAVALHPRRVGFGIDEKTALLVTGRSVRVLGKSAVTVCLAASGSREAREDVHMPGSVLDLVTLRRAARFRASGEDHAVRPGEPEVAKGTLILVGGGAKSRRIWRRFIQAAGGVSAPIVVIPTAAGRRSAGAVDARTLRTLGVLHVTVLHATDKREIESDAFLAPLRCAKGIWFTGGRQWRLVDAYEGTKALALFHDVLRRGGVIGGSSAGTSIQGEFMVRGNPLGNAEIYMEGYERGFGFLPGAGVDQHFTERRRLPDMKLLMRTYPKLLGIGIDESTAIVVQKRSFTVIGPGQVFVCGDGAAWTALRRGEQYDMARREKLPPAP